MYNDFELKSPFPLLHARQNGSSFFFPFALFTFISPPFWYILHFTHRSFFPRCIHFTMQMSFMHFCTYAIQPADTCIARMPYVRIVHTTLSLMKFLLWYSLNKSFEEGKNFMLQKHGKKLSFILSLALLSVHSKRIENQKIYIFYVAHLHIVNDATALKFDRYHPLIEIPFAIVHLNISQNPFLLILHGICIQHPTRLGLIAKSMSRLQQRLKSIC